MQRAQQVLQDVFGFAEFRTGQAEVIQRLLDNQDCLAIMPTGGGKSLCYQIPAIVKTGLTVVVSPLISLMKDQVDSLQRNGVNAAYLNSTLEREQQFQIYRRLQQGEIKLLYIYWPVWPNSMWLCLP
jgi:ATP-dependent DNA helicase RecQ